MLSGLFSSYWFALFSLDVIDGFYLVLLYLVLLYLVVVSWKTAPFWKEMEGCGSWEERTWTGWRWWRRNYDQHVFYERRIYFQLKKIKIKQNNLKRQRPKEMGNIPWLHEKYGSWGWFDSRTPQSYRHIFSESRVNVKGEDETFQLKAWSNW